MVSPPACSDYSLPGARGAEKRAVSQVHVTTVTKGAYGADTPVREERPRSTGASEKVNCEIGDTTFPVCRHFTQNPGFE